MTPELRSELFDRLCEIESKTKFNQFCDILNELHWTHVKWDGLGECVLPMARTIGDVIDSKYVL